MNQRTINFLPRDLHAARQQRRLARRVWVAVGVYLLALGATTGSVLLASRPERQTADATLLTADAQRLSAKLEQARAQLTGQQHALASVQRLAGRADPGLLLPIVAQQTRDEITLRELRIEPLADGMNVQIRGVARSYASASGLAVKLEKLGLFRSTQLLRTDREPGSGGDAVVFNIMCTLEGK